MKRMLLRAALPSTICGTLLVASCGGSDSGGVNVGDPDGSAVDPADGSMQFGDGGFRDVGLPPGCATETQRAKQQPLDIYMMIDTSGSMGERIGTGPSAPTKWDAVKSAITSFLNDQSSAGIGVGIQYFPIIVPNSQPQTCANDAACGALTPCIHNRACAKAGPIQFCQVDQDCGGNIKCADLGTCQQNPNTPCLNDNTFRCATGACNYFTLSYCSGRDKCGATDYATPAVTIAPLPGVASSVVASMNARAPDGLTPTGPALQGGINQAKTFAGANPGHVVVTVLATDGFPTECAPQDIGQISQIAATGVSGSPSVKTFVIGVFSQAEQTQATQNLNQIAQGGGTNQAFVITTNQNVSQAFLSALNQIRGTSLPCDYLLPIPESGTPDYDKVNVQFTSGAASTIIPYVKTASACDAQAGGWYYDVDPSSGKPSKVVLCPASCMKVKGDASGRIDIVQGCQTVIK